MRWLAGIVALLAAASCAAPPSEEAASSEGAATVAAANEPMPRSELPEVQAFLGWTEDASLVEPPRVQDAPHVAIACADEHLFPTHPSSDRKRYHRVARGRYDQFKVDGNSNVCKIKGSSKDPQTGLLRCALADEMQYIVLSDTFEDACGNLYRGFWAVSFLGQDETMGTLMSKGRTVYDVPHAEFKGEVYDAQTYAIDASQLLFASSLMNGDLEAIAKDRANATAAKTHRYNATTHLWEYIGPNL